ncbi:endopeptidase La [Ktedonosporobacter rubrisoli]|uniref:Lon protease n=1 Tax=Ktedonosporobacter rubrisoli TaxID=2509675 RepID=A0A4V0Z0A9_KTERU|nr:endopeptidase La [Ktedonosporobacter rubrisoli]QBD82581.1 endopeptidase La [Ktedonosporobacter rubrisoli]
MDEITKVATPEQLHSKQVANDELNGSKEKQREVLELPLLPVRNTVLLPNATVPLLVGRDQSIKAIEEATGKNQALFVVTQLKEDLEEPGVDDLYTVGVEGFIDRVLKMPDGTLSILIRGQRRLRRLQLTQHTPFIRALTEIIEDEVESTLALEALKRAALALFEKCIKLSNELSEEVYITAMNIDHLGAMADFIISSLDSPTAVRQRFLETFDIEQRLQQVNILLAKELDILELEHQIQSQVQQELDKHQREYFLREQLKIIQRELGEGDSGLLENEELRTKIHTSGMPEAIKTRATKELNRLNAMPSIAPDSSIIRTYLDWLTSLPWQKATPDRLNLKEAEIILDENHYGLNKVKERILEYIAVRKLSCSMRSPILCLVGPPGVGKTSLGRSIAQALNRKFVRLSLGGVQDEAEIRGHRRTYVGALPGRIIQTMKRAGTINPLFVLDEIDKIGTSFRGDPAAALLEVLDPEQNNSFSDHYLEVPYDLSHAIFLTTANILHPIPEALRDRLEIIELPGYTEEEKLHIARQFLLPRQLAEHGLKPTHIEINDEAIYRIIREYTYEAGVRNLERELATILRKVVRKVAEGRRAKTRINASKIPEYLGPQRHYYTVAEEKDEAGIATGVAWTSAGGDLITVEALLLEGRGRLHLTGQLGDVMKESAQAALSYARSRAAHFGLEKRFYEKYDFHLHLPAGATPKDGPSAGITMATALISALSKRSTRRDVAMTGEITLRGRVLPVGGIKEKVLAAHRAGIKTFILPKRNIRDLEDVPQEIIKVLQFVPVEHMDDVIQTVLHANITDADPAREQALPAQTTESAKARKHKGI